MTKNEEIVYNIIENNSTASITVIMKILYLLDLISLKERDQRLTGLKYKRYFYGPFSSKVYIMIENLLAEDYIATEPRFTRDTDYLVYKINKPLDKDSKLTHEEQNFLNNTLKEFEGMSAKILTEFSYQTKPMKNLGATLGGKEFFDTELILDSVLNN